MEEISLNKYALSWVQPSTILQLLEDDRINLAVEGTLPCAFLRIISVDRPMA